MPSELEPRLADVQEVIDVAVIEPGAQAWSSLWELRHDVERLRERLDVAQTRKGLLQASLDHAVERITLLEAELVALEQRARARMRALFVLAIVALLFLGACMLGGWN
jgi:hypothetical protein